MVLLLLLLPKRERVGLSPLKRAAFDDDLVSSGERGRGGEGERGRGEEGVWTGGRRLKDGTLDFWVLLDFPWTVCPFDGSVRGHTSERGHLQTHTRYAHPVILYNLITLSLTHTHTRPHHHRDTGAPGLLGALQAVLALPGRQRGPLS